MGRETRIILPSLLGARPRSLVRIAFSDARTGEPAARYGLAGFAELLGDRELHGMVAVTLVFVAACVALQLSLGLGLAVALGWFFARVERYARGMPVHSFRVLFAFLVVAMAINNEATMGVFASVLLQGTVGLGALLAFMHARSLGADGRAAPAQDTSPTS